MKTRVVALAQTKGGSSKSCTAINLACAAVQEGHKVAILDMDAGQLTALRWGEKRAGTSPLVRECRVAVLEEVLDELRREGYGWIFIDLPGRDSPAVSAGVSSADMVLIPCRPTDIDLEPTFGLVTRLVRSGTAYTYLMGISPPARDKHRARLVADVLQNAGHPVSPVIIVQRLAVSDAVAAGKGVNEFEPGGDAAREFSELFEWLKGKMK